jgi:uncharacterized protein (TIGR02186 family)
VKGQVFPALLVAFLTFVPAAHAEDLVSGLSQDSIEITSNYAGSTIVVFGAIERPTTSAAKHDIVVIVRGPPSSMTVRKKDHVAGIWINNEQATFYGMPSYYFAASTRPIEEIAARELLDRYGLGLRRLEPSSVRTRAPAEPFRLALIRRKQEHGLYAEIPNGVEFLSETLFRVRVPVPAEVARGEYTAEVYLFEGGNMISAQVTPFYIDQTGLERQLFNFAHEWPFIYGTSAVAMALMLGWLSSLFFRQSL